jgi:hypothetical protein
MSLDVKVTIVHNPYPDTVPDDKLRYAITQAAEDLADELEIGEYRRNAIAFCVMDPTAGVRVDNRNAVMALVTIGDARGFLDNAVAKAFEHRDYGDNCGVLRYTQLHRLPDGTFVFGHSANVDGTIVGGSALLEIEDRWAAFNFGSRINLAIQRIREKWLKDHPHHKWFAYNGAPGIEFIRVATLHDTEA